MDLNYLFKNFKKEAFRLELLKTYCVEEEQESFQKFKKGITFIDYNMDEFCKFIARMIKEGKSLLRIHIIPNKLNNYLRFEIQTAYIPQLKSGSRIYLLDKQTYSKILKENFDNKFKPIDFWLFDDKHLVEMFYGPNGNFIKEIFIKNKDMFSNYLKLKETLLKVAIPLDKWIKSNKKLLTPT